MKLINILKEITVGPKISVETVIELVEYLKEKIDNLRRGSRKYTISKEYSDYMVHKYDKYEGEVGLEKYSLLKCLNHDELKEVYLILLKTKNNISLNEINLKKAAAAVGMAAGSMLPFDSNKNTQQVQTPISFDKKEKESQADLETFLKAIHQVESGGKLGAIVGDDGRALGPFQIHKRYWADVAPQIGGRYQDVTDYNYARKVMIAYFLKYAKDALQNKDWEKLAKIHNGGPKGHKKTSTEKYWTKVKSHL